MKEMSVRISWLDSLRGIAALMVAIMHLWEFLKIRYIEETATIISEIINLVILDCLNFGKLGIVIFFMISGYVIPFSLKNKNIKKFVVTRFFRLYPAYWFSILLFIVVGGSIPSIYVLVANVTMFHKFAGIPDLVGVYWTLQIELSFYMLCCLLFYKKILFKERTISTMICGISGIALIMSYFRYVMDIKFPVALLLGIVLMFLGMQWRIASETSKYNSLKRNVCLFIFILIPVCFLAYNKDFGYNEKWYKYFVSYLLGLFMFYLFSKFRIQSNPLRFLGNISYSVYLLHPASLVLLSVVTSIYPLSFYQYISFFIISMFLFSVISYYFIEKPMIKTGRKFHLHQYHMKC